MLSVIEWWLYNKTVLEKWSGFMFTFEYWWISLVHIKYTVTVPHSPRYPPVLLLTCHVPALSYTLSCFQSLPPLPAPPSPVSTHSSASFPLYSPSSHVTPCWIICFVSLKHLSPRCLSPLRSAVTIWCQLSVPRSVLSSCLSRACDTLLSSSGCPVPVSLVPCRPLLFVPLLALGLLPSLRVFS